MAIMMPKITETVESPDIQITMVLHSFASLRIGVM